MYLQPIFDSKDIAKQLPIENKKFKTVDFIWKKLINQVKDKLFIIKVCADEAILEKLKDCNEKLE